MRNIKDWCISRQLWWGHRIPAWYDEAGPLLRGAQRGRGARRARPRRRRCRCARTRTCSTPGSPRRCGRSRPWAGRERHAGAARLLPDLGAGHGLRHHLLLGRPHDHDGPEVHRRGAVPRGLRARPDPRPRRPEDVQVEGQRHRSAGHRRRHRARGAARQAHQRPDAAADEAGDREGDPQAVPARASPPSAPTRCASPSPRSRPRAATCASTWRGSRATATSATSCGTRRATC